MVDNEEHGKSMHNSISSILTHDRSDKREFGGWTQVEDAGEIEYLLARAEADLREARARVAELKRELAKS